MMSDKKRGFGLVAVQGDLRSDGKAWTDAAIRKFAGTAGLSVMKVEFIDGVRPEFMDGGNTLLVAGFDIGGHDEQGA
jgi:hypothetical protein